MIDPLLSLSFNLHAQRGTYALLLGSGISRSASIPTGWEVTLDLVAKLAHLQGEECEGTEARWYEDKFGKEPDYSEVLSSLASTSAAQQQLLKTYFEPTDEEREEGKKLPTPAHRAIAKLVASGHIRVVVTTNFDRLLEAALESEGIAPVVIASSDAARGAPPLVHSACTVIKVHGDYLDHRIKNSQDALAKYDRTMNRLLDQVFDEYGLIICGWSGEYDVALRNALERSKARRYPMYWTGLRPPKGVAENLINAHSAHFIHISGADNFFDVLFEKVEALEEFNRPHPLSTKAAVATLKRYLSEDKHRIQLRDFLVEEAKTARGATKAALAATQGKTPDSVSGFELLNRLEAANEKQMHIFANGSYFAREDQARAFFDSFRLSLPDSDPGGYKAWVNFQNFSALLHIYVSGIAAVSSENYNVFSQIALRPCVYIRSMDQTTPTPFHIYAHSVIERDFARKFLPGMDRRYTPVSDHFMALLREPFAALIPDDRQYEVAFDNFEYLWCLLHVDQRIQLGVERIWAPYGTFVWRRMHSSDGAWLGTQIQYVLESPEATWPPLEAGLFGGSFPRLREAMEKARPMLQDLAAQFH
jgi:hypothetical protein